MLLPPPTCIIDIWERIQNGARGLWYLLEQSATATLLVANPLYI